MHTVMGFEGPGSRVSAGGVSAAAWRGVEEREPRWSSRGGCSVVHGSRRRMPRPWRQKELEARVEGAADRRHPCSHQVLAKAPAQRSITTNRVHVDRCDHAVTRRELHRDRPLRRRLTHHGFTAIAQYLEPLPHSSADPRDERRRGVLHLHQ